MTIHSLLAHLDSARIIAPAEFQGWHIFPVSGGANNLLYRVSGESGDYAVKFTLKDERRRAEREFNALTVLQTVGVDLAPLPVLLDMEAYSQPVTVQTWIEGDVVFEPPQTDADWSMLLTHLINLHSIPPEKITLPLPHPVLYAENSEQCQQVIRYQLAHLPPDALPDDARRLITHFENKSLPDWATPVLTLVRSDPNPRNFIRREKLWASVDWEYSGMTDPAFEIADMIAHAAYIDVPRERWEWVIERYCALKNDPDCEIRIRTYWQTLVMWWVIRFNRYFYDIPRGLDARLVERPANWRETGEAKYQHYLALAEEMI